MSKIGLDNYSSNSKGLRQAKQKYLLPQPRVNLGMELRGIATSMIDISDGLVQDATHLAINSNLSLELNVNQLPLPSLKSLQKKELLSNIIMSKVVFINILLLHLSLNPSYQMI